MRARTIIIGGLVAAAFGAAAFMARSHKVEVRSPKSIDEIIQDARKANSESPLQKFSKEPEAQEILQKVLDVESAQKKEVAAGESGPARQP
jgi:hypothetical protein